MMINKTKYVCNNLTCLILSIDINNPFGIPDNKERTCPLCGEKMQVVDKASLKYFEDNKKENKK